jgi:hypothetical protein
MGLLQDSTNPKAVAFLEGMAKIQELADNFIANPTDDNYIQFRSYMEPAELYIISVMGFDPYVKMEAVSMLGEIKKTVLEAIG